MNRKEVQDLYNKFYIKRERTNMDYFFQIYNQMTGKNTKKTNCSTCLIRMKGEFEGWLTNNKEPEPTENQEDK